MFYSILFSTDFDTNLAVSGVYNSDVHRVELGLGGHSYFLITLVNSWLH